MAKPRLLLLDEPSLGLSPALVTEIFRTLMDLRSMGVSILLAEQNAGMSLAIAVRGYVIEAGQIVLSGSETELLNPFHCSSADQKNVYGALGCCAHRNAYRGIGSSTSWTL